MRKFYNYTADFFRTSPKSKDGSLILIEETIQKNVKISLWKASKNFSSTALAENTIKNSYEINLDSRFSEIQIGYMVHIHNLGKFVIEQIIFHHNVRGKLDNIQAFITEKI